MKRYDVIVVGGGPAGSTTAYRLADAGASVLLVDRDRFPRDKPCGGGLTVRAVHHCPIDPTPAVEAWVDAVQIRFRYRDAVLRSTGAPVIWMTQRRRLDALLLDGARERGVEVRDGVKVRVGADCSVVFDSGERVVADAIVGADGANGATARAVGLGQGMRHGIGYEGNVPYELLDRKPQERTALIELADIPGGYAWVFPKEHHVNIGVCAWQSEGRRLRGHLDAACAAHGVDPALLENLRGHRMPLRGPATQIANDRALLVGDAAGLMDPVSGDGMYECFVSSKHASRAILDLLAGRESSLQPYRAAIARDLGALHEASHRIQTALDRWPRASWRVLRTRVVWRTVQHLIEGDMAHPGERRGMARLPMDALGMLGR